jgi:uncharacterized protein
MRPSHAPLAALVLTAIAGTPAFADPTPTATRVAPANAPAGQALPTPAPKAHPAHSPKGGKHAKGGPPVLVELDWKQLLPENERKSYSPLPPPPVHDYRGEAGPPAAQNPDFKVNKSLDGALVRLPGFIIPLEARRDGVMSEFLLVPYFGACIHVPPPPPNQIVHVTMPKRAAVQSIYDAYWITGTLKLQTRATQLGSAAYELSAEKIETYQY